MKASSKAVVEKIATLVFLNRNSADDSTALHAEVQSLLGVETLSESKEVAHNSISFCAYCLS